MKTIIKTGYQSVFKSNPATWFVLCIVLILSTFFLEYTIAFYRYLSYDTQLESADYCYTISKENMSVVDVNAVKKILVNNFGKEGYSLVACSDEDSFGNPVYLTEKFYHNSTFLNYNKNEGVFPAQFYTVGNEISIAETKICVSKTIENDIVQLNVNAVNDDFSINKILIRFNRPLSQKSCDDIDAIFKDNPSGYAASGKPASKPTLKNESFIVLNLLFYLLIIVVIAFAIYWINVKSKNYYKTLLVLGYGKIISLLPVCVICLTAAIIFSAIGTVLFYLCFCLTNRISYVGTVYATDFLIVVGIEIIFIVAAVLSGSLKKVIKDA